MPTETYFQEFFFGSLC